jgi:hypothetical protein
MTTQYYIRIDRDELETKMIKNHGFHVGQYNNSALANHARLATNSAKALNRLREIPEEFNVIEFTSTNFTEMEEVIWRYELGEDVWVGKRDI